MTHYSSNEMLRMWCKHRYTPLDSLPKVQLMINNLASGKQSSRLYPVYIPSKYKQMYITEVYI